MVRFKNNQDALEKLLNILNIEKYRNSDYILLSLSENALFYTEKLSQKLSLERDYFFAETISAPNNQECKIGSISETKDIFLIDELIESFEISYDYVYEEAKRVYEEDIIKYLYKYRFGEPIEDLKGKKVILVDEGANTGLTLDVAIKSCINQGVSQLDIIMPIIPKKLADYIKTIVDDYTFVYEIENFVETNFYFEDRKEKYEL